MHNQTQTGTKNPGEPTSSYDAKLAALEAKVLDMHRSQTVLWASMEKLSALFVKLLDKIDSQKTKVY